MSDSEREDDLFGGSEAGSASNERQQSPVASSSKAGSPSAEPKADGEDAEGDAEIGDLFGDDDEDDEAPKAAQRQRRRSTTGTSRSRSGSANPLEYPEEEDVEVQRHEERWATLPLPQWDKMKATDDKVWHMKLPAYVNLDSRPYDPDLYRETLDEEPVDGKTDPIAAKSRMIGVRNTIRWKWVTGGDGEPTRQSNARMLRWSDGSVSLQLGSDLFDVAPSHGATLARPSDPIPPIPAGKANEKVVNTVSSTTFLCAIAPQEQVLVTERAIAGQLSLLPTSMDSKTHLELVKHVGQQHVKHSRMKMLEETADEDTLQKLLLKSAPNVELIKSTKKPATSDRRSNLGGRSGTGLGRTGSGLGSKKKSFKNNYYSDSSEEDNGSESDRGGRPRNQIRKIRGASREAAGAGGEYDEDDGFVVADSDEDDEYGASSKLKKKSKNKKRKSKYTDDDDDDENEELDEMEEAERRIEERERERKRAKKESAGASSNKKKSRDYVDTDEDEEDEGGAADEDKDAEGEEDMEMDVESEED